MCKYNEQAQKAISAAKVFMLLKLPFFGILITRLGTVQNDAINTVETDGVNLYYNPNFINMLKDRESIVFVLLHEILHLVFGHLYRRRDRNFETWNLACDYAVNGAIYQYQQLLGYDKKYFTMLPFALFSLDYLNKSAEEIYVLLVKQEKENLSSFIVETTGQKLLDTHQKWLSKNCMDVGSTEWEHFAKSILKYTRCFENILPGCVITHIDKFFLPKKDWRQELLYYLEPVVKDYTFSPPDRRFMLYDFFVPSEYFYGEGIKNIYFYVDTSGSVSNQLVKEFVSEVMGCYAQFSLESEIYFGTFDTEASTPVLLEDIANIKVIGKGGTSPISVFRKLEQLNLLEEIKLLIILTDGYFYEISRSIVKDIPVLWVISPNGSDNSIKKSGWNDIIYL